MANQWAIAVGINHYEHFQPLGYAQQDAQALRNFLVAEAGFSPERCLLLTETSPSVLGKPTYPSRKNILGWLDHLIRNLIQPGDLLWYFFSGYGVCLQGEDYLMPIEGHPAAITTTAISMRSLFTSFKALPTESMLVLLDMNRNQGSLVGEATGIQTAELASRTGISTVLSCRPGEFSRETSALGLGFFTAALLESLRYQGCNTLANLDRYLSDRVPELSEHHWRPIQQPLVISPPEKFHQILLPQGGSITWEPAVDQRASRSTMPQSAPAELEIQATTNPGATAVTSGQVKPTENGRHPVQAESSNENPAPFQNGKSLLLTRLRSTSAHLSPLTASQSVEPSPSPVAGNLASTSDALPLQTTLVNGKPMATQPTQPSSPGNPADDENSFLAADSSDRVFWQRLILASGAIAALLFLVAIGRNWSALVPPTSVASPSPQPATAVPATGQNVTQPPVSGSPAAPSKPGADLTKPNPTRPDGTKPVQPFNTSPFTDTPQTTKLSPQPAKPTGSQRPVGLAAQQPNSTTASTQQRNQLLLQQARGGINGQQASSFYQAIAKARQIQPGQPLHNQAQQEIANWSQAILDIAGTRANQEDFDGAIAAAKFVPTDNAKIHQLTQQSIQQWQGKAQQLRTNQAILQAARQLIRVDQASTYNQAVRKAREIPQGQPKYAEAQQEIASWSQQILAMARRRANRGGLNSAIATARLVPTGTPFYVTAQVAIAEWTRQQGWR